MIKWKDFHTIEIAFFVILAKYNKTVLFHYKNVFMDQMGVRIHSHNLLGLMFTWINQDFN